MKVMTIKKYILMGLTLLPIRSIATIAESAVLDIAGEEQSDLILMQLRNSRRLLLPLGAYSSTLDAAKARLKDHTGIEDPVELNLELEWHLKLLQKNGILFIDENQVMSSGPSGF